MSHAAPSSLTFFSLLQSVGSGAMGDVWLAEHRSGARVAIKFLRVDGASGAQASAELYSELLGEVQAAARLAHPNIVTVLDHGVVDRAGAESTDYQIAQGSPFLVMEFVPGRSLQTVVGRTRWTRMRELLLALLDALAHSHARGVIHRDLKPGNVLLRQAPLGSADRRRALDPLITDFGVAHAFTDSKGTREVVGTPAYMAPEQLQARWRDQGPWTDLYSLGCLAWSLATGEPPFGRGRTFEENREAHLHAEPPAFEPLVEVPRAFEGWLRRLLRKAPSQRYTRAADAAMGLMALPARVEPGTGLGPTTQERRARPPAPDLPTLADAPEVEIVDDEPEPDTATLNTMRQLLAEGPVPPRVLRAQADPLHPDLPPRSVPRSIPSEWRRPKAPTLPPHLLGVGLNLFGLREAPMVGRQQEREALWMSLRMVAQDRRPRAVVLEGPSGCGKTRLMQWLCERALELGSAAVLSGSAAGTEHDGGELAQAFARHFRAEAMGPEQRMRRLTRKLGELGFTQAEEVRALMELVGPGDSEQTAPRVLATPGERTRLQLQLMRGILEGPEGGLTLILAIDDAQWSADALELTRALLEHPDADLPVLVVLTAQTDSRPDRPLLRALYDRLLEHPAARTVAVAPLSDDDTAELVQLLLGIEGGLVAKVTRRSAGNPHYAVEIVRDWVQDGKLKLGREGFELQQGVLDEMPRDLQHTWRAQVERQLAKLTPEEVRALELAAALGNTVDAEEWRAVCAITNMNPSERLQSEMLRSRMAQPTQDGAGWSFTNPMYREVLEVRSRNAGRYRRIHLACARALEPRGGRVPGVAERVARHLLKAGQGLPATGSLLQAARERLERGQAVEAERIVDITDKVFRRLRLPTEDPLWGKAWVHKARLYRLMGEPARAHEYAEKAARAGTKHGWQDIEAEALAELQALSDEGPQVTPL